MSYLELLRLVAPEAILTVTILVVLAVGLTRARARGFCSGFAAAGLLFAAAAVLDLPREAVFAHGMIVISPLNSLFQVICLGLAFFTVLLARGEVAAPNNGEYLALLLLATLGLLLLVGSEELLMIFIGLELTGLSLYILTAFDRSNLLSAEAALKYFLFGSTASAFTLFGLSLIYGMTGTTALNEMAAGLTARSLPPLLFVGVIMTLAGLAFKVAAAPFHLWAPDTYEAAPIPSAAFIASGSKVASFVVMGKLMLLGFGALAGNAAWHSFIAGWKPVLAILAGCSILLGNFVALAQKNVRRLLAYSAVAHAGYTLLGLIAGGRAGLGATLFYTTIYAFTLVGAFAVVGLVRRMSAGDTLSHFAGLRKRSPLLAGCMAIFLLSLAGLPPLAGFFGKFYLFSVTMRAGAASGLLWLVVVALFGSLVSLYYYLIILKMIFVDPPVSDPDEVVMVSLPQRLTVTLLATLILAFGLWPSLLLAPILGAMP